MTRTFRNAAAGALFAFALLTSGVAGAGPLPAPPAAQAFKIGALSAWSLHDAQFTAPNDGKTFGVGQTPEMVSDVLRHGDAPSDMITLSVNVLLVKSPGHIMLFDTGLGAKLGGGLLKSLALTGTRPEDVTDIFITHSHGDHIGGLAADGRLVFPNATIRMSAKEWAFMQVQAATVAAVVAPKVVTFTPGAAAVPGVMSIALEGHTPGHTAYLINSGRAHLTDIGDTAHSSIISLAKPEWAMAYDTDKAEGKTTRRAELTQLATAHAEVFAPHFPYPGMGKVVASGEGFTWEPRVVKQDVR